MIKTRINWRLMLIWGFLTLMLYGLGTMSTGDQSATDLLINLWQVILMPTVSMQRVIPIVIILQLCWLRQPSAYELLFKLNSVYLIIKFYYQQVIVFLLVFSSALIATELLLSMQSAISFESLSLSVSLLVNYTLGIGVLGGMIIAMMLRWHKPVALMVMIMYPYIDQWFYTHLHVSTLFFHGMIAANVTDSVDVVTFIQNVSWYLVLIGLVMLVNVNLIHRIDYEER